VVQEPVRGQARIYGEGAVLPHGVIGRAVR